MGSACGTGVRPFRVGAGVIFLTAAIHGGASADDLAEALATHSAAVASVDTIHFKFNRVEEVKSGGGSQFQTVTTAGEYWRRPDISRLTYTQGGETHSVYHSIDKIILTAQFASPAPGYPAAVAHIVPNSAPAGMPFSPWRDALFGFESRRVIGTQPLADHVNEFLKDARYSVTDGFGVITSENETAAVHIRLDPKRNNLVARRSYRRDGVKTPTAPSTTQQIEEVVQEFQQPAGGIYFPKKVVVEERLGDALRLRRTVAFTVVSVNKSIDAKVFEPRFKDGTKVTDRIKGTQYVVDGGGTPQGPETPISILAVGPQSPGKDEGPALPTAEEPRRWGWWLAPAGLGLVFFGLAVRFWRRKRN